MYFNIKLYALVLFLINNIRNPLIAGLLSKYHMEKGASGLDFVEQT